MDPPFGSNPLFCKGFHAFSGLQWPISGPLEPKKRFFAKKVFLINDQVGGPSYRFEPLNQKNYFESKKLFQSAPTNQFGQPIEKNKNLISSRRYGKKTPKRKVSPAGQL